MRAGIVAGALIPPPPWSWNPSHLEVGANLQGDPDWDTLMFNSSRNWVVEEDAFGDKYISHWESGNVYGALYSSVYLPSQESSHSDVVVTVGGLGGSFEVQGAIVRVHQQRGLQRGYIAVLSSSTAFTIYRADGSAIRTLLSTVSLTNTVATDKWSIRAQAMGDTIRAKAWLAGETEPDEWMVEGVDDTYPTGGAGFAGYNRRSYPRAFWSIESRI